MKASAVLNDKDVWAMAPREEKSNNSTSFLFRMGKEDWIWFLFAEQRGPKGTVQLFNQFNELIECCCSIGVWWSWVWFVFVELGGLWPACRQWLRPKKQTKQQTKQSNQTKTKERECRWSKPNSILFFFFSEEKKRLNWRCLLHQTGLQAVARQAHQQNQTFLSPAAREEMLIVVEWGRNCFCFSFFAFVG